MSDLNPSPAESPVGPSSYAPRPEAPELPAYIGPAIPREALTPKQRALIDRINMNMWCTIDPYKVRELFEANGRKLPKDHMFNERKRAREREGRVREGNLVTLIKSAKGTLDGAKWGFMAYRVIQGPPQEESTWNKWKRSFQASMKRQIRTEPGGERITDGLDFEWVDLPVVDGEDPVVVARSHFSNLLETEARPDYTTSEIFFLIDDACISSLLNPVQSSEGKQNLPYVTAVDPYYSTEESYEGDELGYKGTLKVHIHILLVEFWTSVSEFGAALGIDEVAVSVLGREEEVWNGPEL